MKHPTSFAAAVLGAVSIAVLVSGCSRTTIAVPGEGALTESIDVAAVQPSPSTVPVAVTVLSTPTVVEPLPSTPAPSTEPAPPAPAECVAALPLEWRAGQVLMPAAYGDRLDAIAPLIDDLAIGGIVLMTWPGGADPAGLLELKERSAVPLLISTDEEGGDVQRLRSLGVLPSQADVAATSTPAEARDLVAAHAADVAALGVDLVLGPVVDVGSAAPIGRRSFGDDPDLVTAFATAYVDAWLSAGVTPVLKHFPGHGRASADTHTAAASTPPLGDLESVEFVPYRSLAHHAGVAVMVGHLDTVGLTDGDGVPASLSPTAISTLRSLGYDDALVVTDALNMGAVPLALPAAAVASLAAGADVLLYTDTARTAEVRAAIVDAVLTGAVSADRLDESVLRILTRKRVDPCSIPT
ncbi:MAG: hypothetical protein RLZZ01_2113 [Actinomycetota bacterium]